MVIPGGRIAEVESGDTGDTDSVESYPDIASIVDVGESSDILSPGTPGIPPPPVHTRSYGKAKKDEGKRIFFKGYGVVYLPGDINGLTKKLHLLLVTSQSGTIWFMYWTRCLD